MKSLQIIEGRNRYRHPMLKANRFGTKRTVMVLIAATTFFFLSTWVSPLSAAITVPESEQAPREHAYSLLQLDRYEEAKKLLDTVLAETPDDGIALHYRGIARYHLKDYNGAIGDYYEALKRRPDDASILTSLAIARYHTGDGVKAAAYLEQALKKDPTNSQALNQLAWILSVSPNKQLRDGKRAVQLAKKLVAQNENAHTLDTLAAAYAADGQFDKAISTQKKVIAILANENQTDQLSRYLDRLQAYEKHKVWKPKKPKKKKTTGPKDKKKQKATLDQQPESKDKKKTKQEAIVEEKTSTSVKADEEKVKDLSPAEKVSKTVAAKSPPIAAVQQSPEQKRSVSQKPNETSPSPGSTTSAYHPYTIQIASLKDRKAAHRKAREFRKKGDPAFTAQITIEPSGVWHRLFYGWFQTAEEAAKTVQTLKKRHFRETFIVKKPYTILMAESRQPELLDRIEERLINLGHMPYRLRSPVDSDIIRLCIGAYSEKSIPQALNAELRKEGYKPKSVLR